MRRIHRPRPPPRAEISRVSPKVRLCGIASLARAAAASRLTDLQKDSADQRDRYGVAGTPKVVNTVKSVEASIDRMIDYLGGPAAFAEFAAPEEDPESDAHLLNGPPLDIDSKISQDDIDKLFS